MFCCDFQVSFCLINNVGPWSGKYKKLNIGLKHIDWWLSGKKNVTQLLKLWSYISFALCSRQELVREIEM